MSHTQLVNYEVTLENLIYMTWTTKMRATLAPD